jgi:RNA polymerase sigma-70 factor (ECF subfamily)
MLSSQVSMQKTTQTDDPAALVAAAQADPARFDALYDQYVGRIYRYLYSRTGNPADAEDLTSQTFLSALEALPRYRHRGYFAAWLFQIARSKVMDHFRGSRPELRLETAEPGSPREALFEQVASAQEVRQLSVLIRELPEADRELIRLRYVADLGFAEMAALLGKREEAVKKALYRLLARLQSRLEVKHE